MRDDFQLDAQRLAALSLLNNREPPISKKVTKWEASDGQTFPTKGEADEHDRALDIENELIVQLRFNTASAKQVARNWKAILHILNNSKGGTKHEQQRD